MITCAYVSEIGAFCLKIIVFGLVTDGDAEPGAFQIFADKNS
jgi:hypothetical protein